MRHDSPTPMRWRIAAIALAEHGRLARCEWLDLAINGIGFRGARALLASPAIRRIPVVCMGANSGDPRMMVSHDPVVGIIVDGLPADGEEAEAQYGHIPWLHLIPDDLPDRYHARAVVPVEVKHIAGGKAYRWS